MMDPEQRFLQSREARTNRKDTASKSLHAQVAQFLTESKTRLAEWSQRVEQANQQADPQQFLLECKQELRLWEQHCLGTTASVNGLDGWDVPMGLPAADWKWLHGAFADGWALWERVYAQVVPKGKFTFVRYRQELARRRALGMPLTQSVPQANQSTSAPPTKPTIVTLVDPQSCLEDLEHVTMEIMDTKPQDASTTSLATIQYHSMSSSVLLFRRLKNCTITIHKPLQALHIVESSDTTIHVKAPIASSIHITSCQRVSLHALDVQQVRIHTTNELHCYLKELRAGAILEASTQISFYGISESIVRDFDWLRSTPSPNFDCQELIPIVETSPDTLSTDTPTPIAGAIDPPIAETIASELPAMANPPETVAPTVPVIEESNANDTNDDSDDDDDEL